MDSEGERIVLDDDNDDAGDEDQSICGFDETPTYIERKLMQKSSVEAGGCQILSSGSHRDH